MTSPASVTGELHQPLDMNSRSESPSPWTNTPVISAVELCVDNDNDSICYTAYAAIKNIRIIVLSYSVESSGSFCVEGF